MPGTELRFEHEIDLPASVVWDALVDPVLLEGWLGAVEPSPLSAAELSIEWLDGSEPTTTLARVERIEHFRTLRLGTDNRGTIEFLLTEVPGGLRGRGTVLELSIQLSAEARFASTARLDWEWALERLDDLLSGRPADWAAITRLRSGILAHMSRTDNIR
ncbi:hypothetical protein BH09ACT3_BH09ACT3_10300 [soil metagenome]